MAELHLRQPGCTYSDCETFTKHREKIKIFRETGDFRNIYKNELDKACLTHDVAYSDSKVLAKGTISDKVLKDKAYEIDINPKYDGYQRGLARMANQFFEKKIRSGAGVKKKLAQELHKSVIKKFKRRKVYARFKDNIWAAGLRAEMLKWDHYLLILEV